MDERMRDAAYASTIDPSWAGAVGGYYGGPNAYNVWARGDWDQFRKNRKLPIWVAGLDGEGEARQAISALRALGVPTGVYTAVDMEDRVDQTYVTNFGNTMGAAGYKVWVYGQASSLFGNPNVNGYWVADYTGTGPFMYNHSNVRATQYRSGQDFDSSTVRDWTYISGPWWV